MRKTPPKPDLPVNLPIIRKALGELQAELRKLYDKNAPLLLIYGSYARGQAKGDSDVDVLLLYPHEVHPSEEIRRVSKILADLNLRYQVLISVLPTSQSKYQTSQDTFWKNVRREGIPSNRI